MATRGRPCTFRSSPEEALFGRAYRSILCLAFRAGNSPISLWHLYKGFPMEVF